MSESKRQLTTRDVICLIVVGLILAFVAYKNLVPTPEPPETPVEEGTPGLLQE